MTGPRFAVTLLLVGLVLLGGLAFPRAARAQAPAGWQPVPGLRGQRVMAMAQRPGQLTWVSTAEGVYRYDGPGQLVPLNELRRGGVALPPVLCHTLLLAPDGYLWLGTAAGIFRFSPAGVLRAVLLPDATQPLGSVPGLVLTPDGRHVWAVQEQVGARRYTLAGTPVGPLLPTPEVLHELWPAPDGTLWLTALSGRTSCYSATGKLLNAWAAAPTAFLRPVAEPGTGRVWLLGPERLYQPAAKGRLLPGPVWRPGNRAAFQLVRRDSTLTALLLDAVVQLGWGKAGQAPRLRPRFAVPLPPPAAAVLVPASGWPAHDRLWFDASGRWWLFNTGSPGAWSRVATAPFIQFLPGPGGLPYSVRSMHRLPGGRLLVSTYGGPLVQAPDSPLAPLRPWPYAAPCWANFLPLMGLVPARTGPGRRHWLAASDHTFLHFDPHANRLTPLPTHELNGGFPVPLGLTRAPDGTVWGVASSGLYVYDSAAVGFRPYRPTPAAPPPLARQVLDDACADDQGHLWLAAPTGVIRLTIATGAQQLFGTDAPAGPRRVPFDGVRCLWLDQRRQRLWVGSRTRGLGLIDLRTGQARQMLSTANGLPSGHVATILPGPGGTLWLGTYAGVVRYHPGSGAVAVFTTADGLSADECNGRAAYLDPADSSLLIGGIAGVHRLYPAQAGRPAWQRPQLLLTALSPLNAAATADSNHPQYLLPPDAVPDLRLDPTHPVLDLHLALTDGADAGQSRFAYRVAGWLNGQWLPLGTAPLLRLQGLPPGRYTVEIRGETAQALAAAATLRLPLTVTAVWWRRPETWALGALAAMAAVFGWQRARLQRQRRDYTRRAQLAADLHDEVGALLTRVTMQAEMLRELKQAPPARLDALVRDSRAAVSTVRDIIWSVDVTADSLQALVDRIRDLLDATAQATGRLVHFDGTGLPADLARPLSPAVRQHVYLICKEAVTNALRHARPDAPLTVALRCTTSTLELTVLNQAAAATGIGRAGQGLRSMQTRAGLLHAQLTAGPQPAGHWQLALRVPL